METDPDALAPWVYVPGREGSLQAEMLAAARRFDRLPLRLPQEPQALIQALEAGSPVLVLQNLGFRRWPRWHYAVLIGVRPDTADFLLRSGTTEREALSARRFLGSWDLAGRWAVVLAGPGQIPAGTTEQAWLAAAAPFESLNRLATAEAAYHAARMRWPQSALPWQALANVQYARGESAAAETSLRQALTLNPQAVAARNNLANLLLARGCVRAAREQLAGLDEIPTGFRDAVERTRQRIEAAGGATGYVAGARCVD